jgi:hypothetical protein
LSGSGTDRASFEHIAALAENNPGVVWHFAERILRETGGVLWQAVQRFFCRVELVRNMRETSEVFE